MLFSDFIVIRKDTIFKCYFDTLNNFTTIVSI